jgi:hypothetical protein
LRTLATGWWSAKLHRTWTYLHASVTAEERTRLPGWLTPAQLALFDAMLAADRRHGLDVVAALRASGTADADLLVAGLLHDCGKGSRVRLVHRVAWSLGQRYGAWIWRACGHLPTFRTGLAALRDHARRSAELAQEAGCTARSIELIRNQEAPTDEAGRLLLAADEAN